MNQEQNNNLNESNPIVNTERQNSFDGVNLIAILFRYKLFIIITVIIVTAASLIISLKMPNWYTAEVNTIPPKLSSNMVEGGMGNISSALKEFGLTKMGAEAESYSYMVILNSRSVRDSLINKYNLAKVYDIPDTMMSEVRKELEDNLEVTLEREGNYTVSVTDKNPQRAAEMANDFVEIVNSFAISIYQSEATLNKEYIENRLVAVDSTLKSISDSLNKYSRKHFLFSPEDQAKSISNAFSDLKAELIKQEITLEIAKNRFGENDAYTQAQKGLIDKLRNQLDDAETKPGFAGNFSLKDATGIGIEYIRLAAEFETFTKVKAFLMPMLEDAKLDESRQTRTLLVVDKALPPEKKSRPKRSLIVLGAAFGSFLLSSLFIVMINGYKNFNVKYKG